MSRVFPECPLFGSSLVDLRCLVLELVVGLVLQVSKPRFRGVRVPSWFGVGIPGVWFGIGCRIYLFSFGNSFFYRYAYSRTFGDRVITRPTSTILHGETTIAHCVFDFTSAVNSMESNNGR